LNLEWQDREIIVSVGNLVDDIMERNKMSTLKNWMSFLYLNHFGVGTVM
jgi:hypothetical protein